MPPMYFFFLLAFLPLLTACGGEADMEDSFTFTAEDAAEISELLDRIDVEGVVDFEVKSGDLGDVFRTFVDPRDTSE